MHGRVVYGECDRGETGGQSEYEGGLYAAASGGRNAPSSVPRPRPRRTLPRLTSRTVEARTLWTAEDNATDFVIGDGSCEEWEGLNRPGALG